MWVFFLDKNRIQMQVQRNRNYGIKNIYNVIYFYLHLNIFPLNNNGLIYSWVFSFLCALYIYLFSACLYSMSLFYLHRNNVSIKIRVVVVTIWKLDLQLPAQSVPITTKVVSSNPAHGEMYLIQFCVVFSRYSCFPHQ